MEAADSKPIMVINVHGLLAKQFREPATRGSMAVWQHGCKWTGELATKFEKISQVPAVL